MLCSIWIILFHYPWKAPEGERIVEFLSFLKPLAKGRNIVGCYILRPFAHPVACCRELLRKIWNRSNFWANNSQHFFCSVIDEA